jgi:hypothetical protein
MRYNCYVPFVLLQPALRVNTVATLNAWIEQTGQPGFVQFVEAEIFSDALKLENPNLKAEVGPRCLKITPFVIQYHFSDFQNFN